MHVDCVHCDYVSSKLMNFYEELHAEFSTATQHLRAGNYLLFFRDMTHKLSDLLFTKGEQCSDSNSFSFHLLVVLVLTRWLYSVECGMPTIQYSPRSAQLSVHKLFTSLCHVPATD